MSIPTQPALAQTQTPDVTTSLYAFDTRTGGPITAATKQIGLIVGVKGELQNFYTVTFENTVGTQTFTGEPLTLTPVGTPKRLELDFRTYFAERKFFLGNFDVTPAADARQQALRKGYIINVKLEMGAGGFDNYPTTASIVVPFYTPTCGNCGI